MSNQDQKFPFLGIPHKAPFGWIQWKGTDVCVDIYCICGARHHFDGEFMYFVKCGDCGRVFECDGHVVLHELDAEPENVKLLGDGEEWD